MAYDYKKAFGQLVRAIVEHAGGGATMADLGDEIHVHEVVEMLQTNADEFERCDKRMRAYKKQIEDAGMVPVTVER